jgi:hypothetical protein
VSGCHRITGSSFLYFSVVAANDLGELSVGPMKWTPGGESQDVGDCRGESGGGGGFQLGGMHVGIGGAISRKSASFRWRYAVPN